MGNPFRLNDSNFPLPTKLPVGFLDQQVVDAGETALHR